MYKQIKMPIYYTGTNFMNKVKQYEGINPRGSYIDFKDAEGKIYKNVHACGWNQGYLRGNPKSYLPVYRDKGYKIVFELNPGQFPFVE